jgi:hypothetical protein
MCLDKERDKSDGKYMVGYDYHEISDWFENGLIKVKIEFMKEDEGKKHPSPLVINIPYPFKNAPA